MHGTDRLKLPRKINKLRTTSLVVLSTVTALPLVLCADQAKTALQLNKEQTHSIVQQQKAAPTHVAPITPTHNSDSTTTTKTKTSATHKGHIWNLQNANIKSVIAEVAKETGKNFIVDPRVSGQVSLISTTPLPPKALYKVFLAMLQTYGFAAINHGKTISIVPDVAATQYTSPVASKKHPGSGSQIVVRVIPVQNVSATQLVSILRPLMPQWASISAYPPTNFLLVSGTAENITRLVNIVNRIDIKSDNDVTMIPLQNANAKQVVKIVTNLQSSSETNGGSTAQVAIEADNRTNSIILSGARLARLRTSVIISQLDQPSARDQGTTQVIFLHYLSAKKIAPILDKIARGQSSITNGGDNSSDTDSSKATSSNTSSSSSDSSSKSGNDISNLMNVLPEQDDNAIVITAPKAMMENLKAIISQLDIRPLQVYVQAIIVELDASSLEKLGFQFGTFMSSSDSTNPSITGDSSSNSPFSGGPGVGVIRNGHFSALAAAIKGLSGADILSEPTIMVQNNKKAQFSSGKQVPVQQSQEGTGNIEPSSGVPQTYTTYNQEDVGLKLTVTPQINDSDSVQLAIDQINASLQNPDNPTTTPIVNKAVIKTSVLVNSGDILVLGGLMSNNMTTNTFSTPILGRIPIIGNLFRYKSHELEKKDLMVFLRPVIVRTPLDGTNITNSKYKSIRKLQLAWKYNSADTDSPVDRLLPPRALDLKLPPPFSE